MEVDDKWRHNDIIVEKVIDIDQNSRSQSVMFSFQIVDRIRRQSPWASCELCSHPHRRRDANWGLSRVGVGGVYWALDIIAVYLELPVWTLLHWRLLADWEW